MTMQNIAAWTAPEGSYPPYVSIADVKDETRNGVSVTVRDQNGNEASATMTRADWADLVEQILKAHAVPVYRLPDGVIG